jgi:hypothetical protein
VRLMVHSAPNDADEPKRLGDRPCRTYTEEDLPIGEELNKVLILDRPSLKASDFIFGKDG